MSFPLPLTPSLRTAGLRGLAAGALLLISACSGTRYIPEKEKLYTGSTVKLESKSSIPNEASLQTELEAVITPKPNGSFLGMRPKLYFWSLGRNKTKGLGHFLADRFGEKPVLLSQVDTTKVKGLMTNRLYNNGYFKPVVHSKVETKGRTARVDYNAAVGRPYLIKKIQFPDRDTLIDRDIRATQGESLLKVGEPYSLKNFTAERVRIDAILKNKGYYEFAPDYLLFQVDSTEHNQVDVYLRVKASAPPRATRPYVLDRVTLNTDYRLEDTTTNQRPILYQGYRYYPDEKMFKAKAITNAVFIYPDSLYRRRRSDQTLSRLMSLGTFKFVDLKFRPSTAPDSGKYGKLDALVRMTQVPKKSLRAEVMLVSKSNGFVGPGVRVQFRNRSALRGAEQLLVNVVGTFENQTRSGSNIIGLTSYELGVDAQLLVPRLIAPNLPLLDVTLPNSDFQPRTTFGAGYRYVERRGAFQEDLFHLNYGYTWKTRITNEQELRPVDLQYIRLRSVSEEFQGLLNENMFLANSFRQQFILGSSYRYTYNQQVLEQRRNQIFFSGGLELSGNLAYLLQSLSGASTNERGKHSLFGQEYSQYTKVDLELRNYFRISPLPTSGNKIATRLLIGAGMPYKNSEVLPYLKQYGIGGPNSVRAFPARGIGPGTYRPVTNEQARTTFYDQVGDLRFEGNLEYRQDLMPYFKGALFVDAGNIWLVNDDPTRPGGKFSAGSFLKELAVGAGAGLRIDVQFFVIRFDYAIPVKAPYGAPEDKTGRLNLAIGYPF
ncbi:BamA/TamA family outer membrane protein [Hymenobacter saemangeumensis]|uniref:BamA/TamA family outer membrane protein n=1 Tax=Hymenobacter saemangeumensis TaxID=1084522 RepID=A0ABP8HYX4_9BACT